ncbi:hypothetical protein IV01_25140 [Pseudomonas syringae]|uniref:GntR family transcriptional regulator n=1 Tax=Pseudomonas syringae TaxID=317 RepID=A0A085V595_PSESX|nr:hypothetical protein IV01_25140 [Pseudomonas syringae]
MQLPGRGGGFSADEPLSSCRKLSQQLRTSRYTVTLVYQSLLDKGYLVGRPRSSCYLHAAVFDPCLESMIGWKTRAPNPVLFEESVDAY